jgi:hypothetical protein
MQKAKIVTNNIPMPMPFNTLDHIHYTSEALKEAELTLQAGEYFIGAVIVHNSVIGGRRYGILCRTKPKPLQQCV